MTCNRYWTEGVEESPPLIEVNPKEEYKKDIWDVRRLGLKPTPGCSDYVLNFTQISQEWLKQAAKKLIKLTLVNLSYGCARDRVRGLQYFSHFLAKSYPYILPQEINRQVIEDFLAWLVEAELGVSSKKHTLSALRNFQKLSRRNEWLPVHSDDWIYDEDFPRLPKSQPNFIPEIVVNQLLEHLDEMLRPYARMVLILLDCGMRISELCELQFDCIYQSTPGNWYMRYYQFKQKKDHTIPITSELAQVVQEQQTFVRQHLKEDFKYLFPARSKRGRRVIHQGPLLGFTPRPEPIKRGAFANALNNLAKKYNIRDDNGKLWHFTAHQFRHTVGTDMANRGLSVIFIQNFLGHASPGMSITYINLHEETKRKEFDAYMARGKVVNIEGRAISNTDGNPGEVAEVEWLRENLQSAALTNGYCRRPKIQGDCPTPPACLNCPCFATTKEFLAQHESHLARAGEAIEYGKQIGSYRIVEINQQETKSLQKIINALETDGIWQGGKGTQKG